MVSFVRKRLQVFVSSTYTDLVLERQAAVEAILTAGHIPAGMELFTSGDESQMEVINQWIDESDVYLLILGGRYGSVEPKTGKSYTQIEYEYAVARGKPLFACVIKDAALESRIRIHGSSVIETEHAHQLKGFRALVLTKMVRFWEDAKDIKITVGETLAQFARRDELPGWVRASQEANMPALADEIARPSKENAQLRSQIAEGRPGNTILGLSFQELRGVLEDKGLLGFLRANRLKLSGGTEVLDGSDPFYNDTFPSELDALGVICWNQNYGEFKLTDAGRKFLNRLELEEPVPDDAGDPDRAP